MKIDLLSADSFRQGHPHAQYDWLREHDPVHWHDEPSGRGFWALTTWEDVAESGRHPDLFSSEPTIMITDPDAGSIVPRDSRHKMMLMMDPPQHTQFRRLISSGDVAEAPRRCERHDKSRRLPDTAIANPRRQRRKAISRR